MAGLTCMERCPCDRHVGPPPTCLFQRLDAQSVCHGPDVADGDGHVDARAGHYDCMSVCRIYVLCAFYGPAPLHRKLHDSKDYTNCTLTVHAVAILRHLHPLRVDIRIRCLCLRWVPTLYGRRNPKHDAEALAKALDNPMSMRTETSLRAIGRDDPAKL